METNSWPNPHSHFQSPFSLGIQQAGIGRREGGREGGREALNGASILPPPFFLRHRPSIWLDGGSVHRSLALPLPPSPFLEPTQASFCCEAPSPLTPAPPLHTGKSFFVRTRTEPHTGPGISEGGREGPSPLCSSRKRWQKNSIQRQETPIPMTQASVQVTIAVVRRDSRCIKAPFFT